MRIEILQRKTLAVFNFEEISIFTSLQTKSLIGIIFHCTVALYHICFKKTIVYRNGYNLLIILEFVILSAIFRRTLFYLCLKEVRKIVNVGKSHLISYIFNRITLVAQ